MDDEYEKAAIAPNWAEAGRVHDWRNYIEEDIREMWETFTIEQKRALVKNADEIASNEEWD